MRRILHQTADLTLASLKMLLRDRTALLTAAIFPVLFLLVFSLYDLSLSPAGSFAVGPATGGVSYFDFVLPGLLALGLMNVTMVGIAASVARFRETAVLRRLAATPVSASAFIAGQVLARLVIAIAQVVLLLALGVALGGTVVGNPLWLLVLATLGNLTFLSLGFAIAGRTTSVDAANNLAAVTTMPLMFLSGMFFPLASLPAAARILGESLPITPLVEAMRAVALDGAGPPDLVGELFWLAGWVPASFLLARLSFRVTPPEARQRHAVASRLTASRAPDAATVDVSATRPSVS